MSFCLGRRSSQCALLMLVAASIVYLYFCQRSFRAWQLAASGTLVDQVRATELEPYDAEYQRQLGDTLLFRENNASASLDAFHRATDLNPRDADAWLGTAYALQVLNRSDAEREALAHALAADPRRPKVIWQAGNLYAVLNDREAVMNQACVLLAHDRTRSVNVLDLVLRTFPNIAEIKCPGEEAAH
jgi:tetratricopeptide (TPR) repeat protein